MRYFSFGISILLIISAVALAIHIHSRLIGGCGWKIDATRTQMAALKAALLSYHTCAKTFPTTRQGLKALVTRPGTTNPSTWQKQLDEVPVDAWGNPIQYACPSKHGMDFALISAGPDEAFGTKDDITNRNDSLR